MFYVHPPWEKTTLGSIIREDQRSNGTWFFWSWMEALKNGSWNQHEHRSLIHIDSHDMFIHVLWYRGLGSNEICIRVSVQETFRRQKQLYPEAIDHYVTMDNGLGVNSMTDTICIFLHLFATFQDFAVFEKCLKQYSWCSRCGWSRLACTAAMSIIKNAPQAPERRRMVQRLYRREFVAESSQISRDSHRDFHRS